MTTSALLCLLVPVAGGIALPQAHARRPGRPTLQAAAAEALPGGVRWGDFDGDGRLDALSVSAEGRLRLLASRPAGFEDVSQETCLDAVESVAVALWGDYDGDGRADLFVGRSAGASLLLGNEGGLFADRTAGAGLAIEEPVRAAHWLDEDGDGRLDLHVVTSTANRVWRGLEGGSFEPVELPLEVLADPLLPVAGTGATPEIGTPGGEVALPRGPRASWPMGGAPDATGRDAGSHGAAPHLRPESGPPPTPEEFLPYPIGCATSIRDQANPGSCLQASSAATLGMLYPLSSKLFVSEATGNVGIGTATPSYRLHVNGKSISGTGNSAAGNNATVSGGSANNAGGDYATVAGGRLNSASGTNSVVGGGRSNSVSGSYTTIGGGKSNVVGGGDYSGNYHTIAGGWSNYAGGEYASRNTVGGGSGNDAAGYSSIGNTVAGGTSNYAGGSFISNATISGGGSNQAEGSNSTVPGGRSNRAGGDYSFAAGRRAKADHAGSFVWGDSQDLDKPSSAADEFSVYSDGGMRVFAAGVATPSLTVDSAGLVGVGTAAPAAELHVEGEILSAGSSGGKLESQNPDDPGESVSLQWSSGVPRIRVEGATTGFAIQGASNQTFMRCLESGDVGIGTPGPATRLHVFSSSDASVSGGGALTVGTSDFVVIDSDEILARDIGGNPEQLDLNADSGPVVVGRLSNAGLGVGRIPATNNLEVEGTASKTTAGTWLANSDRRIKRDVRELENAVEWVRRVRPVAFHYTAEYLEAHPGVEDIEYFNVIAQEFAEVFPEYVTPTAEGILQVDTYPALIHALAAIRELAEAHEALSGADASKDARIAELEKRVVELERVQIQVEALSSRLAALER